MSHIIKNIPCPKCRESGHDKTGNHAIVFADGGVFCGKTHFHKDGKKYYQQGEEGYDVSTQPITGEIQYSPQEFRQLEGERKLVEPIVRSLALAGMRKRDQWEVFNDEERLAQEQEWEREVEWFNNLKRTHLADRGIHGLIAAMYNTRVGHDENRRINRHYYPRYENGVLVGAKCRTLPKDFSYGHLGKLFGEQDLFGMNTFKDIADSGQRKNILLVVGGEPDAMAAQQMFIKEINGLESISSCKTLDKLKKLYVLSVNKGESGVEELIQNKDQINQFKTVVFCFDNDDTGQKLNRAACKMFKDKAKVMTLPSGCKDPNDALNKGRDSEFVTALFNAEEPKVNAKLKRVSDIKEKAREITQMGEKYWLAGFNLITYGIRKHYLSVWGAGTGVGKTDTTMAHVSNLMNLGHDVVVIYLENQIDEVTKTFAGMLVNKDFNSPPQEEWELEMGFDYNPARDYTQEDLDAALELLEKQDKLIIADLNGSKDVDAVMEVMEECFALGYEYFVVDNLTAFEHKDEKGSVSKGVQAIDATMKRLGTFKDENPVNIMLLSHLTKVDASKRIPHTMGGEVYESDFRGAGSITFWANAVWGIERNTMATSFRNKCVTLYRNLKNRGIGHKVGSVVVAEKDIRTGHYHEIEGADSLPEIGRDKPKDQAQQERDSFDTGEKRSDRSAPEKTSEPKENLAEDLPWDEPEQEF